MTYYFKCFYFDIKQAIYFETKSIHLWFIIDSSDDNANKTYWSTFLSKNRINDIFKTNS